MEKLTKIENVISFLQGSKDNSGVFEDSEMLARCITYLLDKKYHRDNLLIATLTLLKSKDNVYRDIAWDLIQKIPLSHLLTILKGFNKKLNIKRLRHAIVTKICNSAKDEIFRAFFIEPEKFRSLFIKLFLPRKIFNDKEIMNENYNVAYTLSTLSVPEVMNIFRITVRDLLDYHIPMDKIMNLITDPNEVEILADLVSAKTFFEHGRWIKNIIGDTKYLPIAYKKVEGLKDPIGFLANKAHLESTGVLTKDLIEALEKRADDIFEDLFKSFKLERLALIVDISGSMHAAIDITTKLYEGFSRVKITDLIAFNNNAITITNERLRAISPDGSTSIGSAIVLLQKRLEKRQKDFPQAVIIITDLEENTPPLLNDTWKLLNDYEDPALVIVQIPTGSAIEVQVPHSIIKVSEFHKSLIMDIVKQIARVTATVVSDEAKEVTKVVKTRKLIDEEIGEIELGIRDPESLKKGFLEKILCQYNILSI